MYYILDCPFPVSNSGEAMLEVYNCFKVGNLRNWWDGKPLKSDTYVPEPFEIEYENFQGYQGEPIEMTDMCIPLMSNRLHGVLTGAGVDNIEYFPVILKCKNTGKVYDYKAFKIVGLVSATDFENSDYDSYDENLHADVSFTSLSIDEKKAAVLPIFRLYEDISVIIVNNRIKTCIENSGIDTLVFIKPEDYIKI